MSLPSAPAPLDSFTLQRLSSSPKGTLGKLIRDAGRTTLCVTCEEPPNGNKPGVSCIPAGSYLVSAFSGTRFKDVWQIEGVPGRSAILIHNGNTIKDTEGCVLVGQEHAIFDGLPGVTNSRATLERLRGILPKQFLLHVRDVEIAHA